MKIYTTCKFGIDIAKNYFNIKNRWIYDKKAIINQINKWQNTIPWIKPFYAVKSNPLQYLLKDITNHNFKVGLDVASIKEIKTALKYTDIENTIYTNPHSIPHECDNLLFNIKVVDSLCELEILNKNNIKCPILIRTNSYQNNSLINFDSKFGATIEEAFEIIKLAKKYNYYVKGISFHIGSGGNYSRKDAYISAYENIKPLLKYISSYEKKPILNFGGGLLYDTDLNDALGWTKDLPYEMIAEPGRYFSEPSHHLAIQVIAKTNRGIFLDNGVYHELNCYHRDHWEMPKLSYILENNNINKVTDFTTSTIFGPTCDSYDTINKCDFPTNIEIGDWIILPNMGAYTNAGMVEFNGIKGASSINN